MGRWGRPCVPRTPAPLRPIRIVVRVNPDYTVKRYEGPPDRRPFQGDVEQIVTDLMAYAGIGLDEFLVDLSWAARDAQELKDVSAEVYGAARAAGF